MRLFHLAFKSRYELSVLREHGQVEVVVVVSNCDLARRVDANSNWVVCDTCTSLLLALGTSPTTKEMRGDWE